MNPIVQAVALADVLVGNRGDCKDITLVGDCKPSSLPFYLDNAFARSNRWLMRMAGRRRIGSPIALALAMLIVTMTLAGVQVGYTATSSNLSVTSSGTVLVAARNNTLTIEIANVGKYVRELDVALTIPPSLVLFGDNHWIRSSFAPGESINASLTIFAPSSAAGGTPQGSIMAVYKVIGETVPTTETHSISFLVRGWIEIEVYEITLSPDPLLPGQELTVSGNILNRGVIAAMYTNVTIDASDTFAQGSIKPTYVGQVDPNAPAPFSVTAVVDPTASDGIHQATISVYYRDDLQLERAINVPVTFTVVSELPTTKTAGTSIASQLLSSEFIVLGLAVVIVLVIVGVYLRRRRKREESA